MMDALQNEEWTVDDLAAMTRSELLVLADELGHPHGPLLGISKDHLIKLLLTGEMPVPSPDDLLREAILLAQWRRGVPPGGALLNRHDKAWLDAMWNAATVIA